MDEIQNNAAETTNDQVNTEVSGASEVADTSNEAQFTDTNDNGNSDAVNNQSSKNDDDGSKQDPKKDVEAKSAKTNADYARERRKAEQEKAVKKARYDAIIEALDGENPYTHEKIEDDQDVEEYLTMKQIAKEGKDPIADYPKFIKNKAKEQEKARQTESSQKEWIAKDREDFAAKHPDVKLEDLLDDDLFRSFAVGKVGKYSMDKIYSDYNNFLTKSEERAKERAAQILANNASSPGGVNDQTPPATKHISEMSSKEFGDLQDRVRRGEKITL